jgi:hypothetical protein
MYTNFRSENLKERSRHRWKDIRMDIKEIGCVWTGFICLRKGTSGRLS